MEDGLADPVNIRCGPDTRLSARENREGSDKGLGDGSLQSIDTKDHIIYSVAHGSICVPKAL